MVKVEDLIIFKGKEQIWDNAKYSVGELDKRKLHRLARAHDAVKSLLVMTRDKEVDPDYGVFMQIPGNFNNRYIIADDDMLWFVETLQKVFNDETVIFNIGKEAAGRLIND